MKTKCTFHKRLAASVLKCGKRRVFIEPSSLKTIVEETTRKGIRRMVKRGLIVKKAIKGQSRFRCRKYAEARRKGRHMGLGKRHGTANARNPRKKVWIRKIRCQRRVLAKYRAQKTIDPQTYRKFYLKAKGNQFKTKKVLIEAIWDAKNAQDKEKLLAEQRNARIARAALRKERAAKRANDKVGAATPASPAAAE